MKFNLSECNRLSTDDIKQALRQEDINSLRETVRNFGIYQGHRMVAASYKGSLHAEYRLLHGEREVYPVQNLMNQAPAAGCIVFYTLYSPCLSQCVNIEHYLNIIDALSVFDQVNETQRAFVFRNIYSDDKERTEKEIWEGWRALNKKMTLYNCKNGTCRQCFTKPDHGGESLPVQQCLHP